MSGGGGVQMVGTPEPHRPWRVGVSDRPPRHGGLAAVVSAAGVDGLSVAVSGTAERGAHLVDPRTGRSAVAGLVSVMVVGPQLTRVVCWAAAAFARGSLVWPRGRSHCPAWRRC